MNYSAQAFFAGQYEGILLVLQALHNKENEKEIDREWITNKLLELGLDEFTNPMLETYFLIKKESK